MSPEDSVVVPNFLQIPFYDDKPGAPEDARTIALEKGLELEHEAGSPYYEVIKQDPEPGSQVAPGTVIKVWTIEG